MNAAVEKMMSKAFWKSFRKGFVGMFAWTTPIAFALMALAYYYHPYEVCDRKYEDYNDVMECVWILTHK